MNNESKEIFPCPHCHLNATSAHLSDKFCRRCGAPRHVTVSETLASQAQTLGLNETPTYATAPLATELLCHPISGPLVKTITDSLAAPQTAQLQSRWGRSLALALTSFSIWLMIVLLSPLDAYAAARATVAR